MKFSSKTIQMKATAQFCWTRFKSLSVTIQMKATDKFFPVVLFILLYKVVLTFNSGFEILKCDHSNESDRAVLSCGVVQDYSSSKFFVILSYAWQSSLPVETHRVQHRNSYLYPPQLSARAVVCQTPLLPFPLACFSNRMN